MIVFVYGALRHRPLLEAVVGDLEQVDLSPDHLLGYRVVGATDGSDPTLVTDGASSTDGLAITGLSADALARLDFYQAVFGAHPEDVMLGQADPVRVHLPRDGQTKDHADWSLEAWVQARGAMTVLAAQEVMQYRAERSPNDVAVMYPMILSRAWSQVNAGFSRHGAGLLNGAVTVADRRRSYANFFALDEYDIGHQRFDGSMSAPATRAVFVGADATLVLPYDPVRDRVLLVEQMRMGPFARGDAHCWQLEPIAGRIDPGETPEQTAHREAEEEAGLALGALHKVSESYASPGNASEFYYCFVALADLPDEIAGLGGLDSEQEDIRSHLMSFDALIELCDSQAAANTPLILIAYWLARHRDRLRSPS